MSGASVAAQLQALRVPVMVVDAGPYLGTTHVAAAHSTRSWLEPENDPCFRPWSAERRGSAYGPGSGARLRVGGRSLYWRGISIRLEDYALADWPSSVANSLVNRDYNEAEEELISFVGMPLNVARNATEQSLLETLLTNGFSSATIAPRAVRTRPGGEWEAYTPARRIRSEQIFAEHSLVTIESGAAALEAIFRLNNEHRRIPASAIVLCAGAIENARMVARILGNLGPYQLVDHHVRGWVCAPADFSLIGRDESSVLVRRDAATRVNCFVESHIHGQQMVLDAWTMGEQLPGTNSSMQFTEDMRLEICVEKTKTDIDISDNQQAHLAVIREAFDFCDSSLAAGDVHDYQSALRCALNHPGKAFSYHCPLGTVDHESCCLPLDGQLVGVDAALRSLPRVFVAGPCLFPRAGAANPSLTTLALSRYVARCVEAAVT